MKETTRIFFEFLQACRRSALTNLALFCLYFLLTYTVLHFGSEVYRSLLFVGLLGSILWLLLESYFELKFQYGTTDVKSGFRRIDFALFSQAIFWGLLLGLDKAGFAESYVPWSAVYMLGLLTGSNLGLNMRYPVIKHYSVLLAVAFLVGSYFGLDSLGADLKEFWVLCVGLALYVLYLRDLSKKSYKNQLDLHRLRTEYQARKDNFVELMNSIPGFVSVISEDRRYLFINRKLRGQVGELEGEILGGRTPDSEFVSAVNKFLDSHATALTCELDLGLDDLEEDGQVSRRFLVSMHRSSTSGQVTVVCIDINELYLNRLELEKSKSIVESLTPLRALAEISSGIAHEINNPMSVILGYPELIEKQVKNVEDEKVKEKVLKYCSHITTSAERVAGIVRTMKTMSSRNNLGQISKVNLEETLNDLYLMAEIKLGTDSIDLVRPSELEDAEELLVWGEGTKILQIVLNLVWNARDAYRKQERGLEENKKIELLVQSTSPDWLRVVVRDWAEGIPLEHQDSIFDHKFTTKENGLGVGLAVSKSFAESIGGELYIENYGNPTAFVLKLRRANQ